MTTPKTVQDAIALLAPFSSTDETRHTICQIVCFEVNVNGQFVISTDGKRLAYLQGEYGLTLKPGETVARKLYHANGTPVLDAMEYPNWQQVIPAECKELIVLPTVKLTEAIKRVAKMTSDKSVAVKMTFENDKLTLTGGTPEVGESTAEVECSYKSVTPLTVSFNPAYLLDMLKALKKLKLDSVVCRLTNAVTPGDFQSHDGTFRVVVMPMR